MSYVYIGQLERQLYGVRTDKFEDKTYFELVYLGPVTIYKVKKGSMSFLVSEGNPVKAKRTCYSVKLEYTEPVIQVKYNIHREAGIRSEYKS